MSWDVFVMHLPDVATVDDIPEDFESHPLGPREQVVQAILDFAPAVHFSDPAWGSLSTDSFSIEFNMGQDEVCDSFALHIRGGEEAVPFVAALLQHLKLRAADPNSDTGFFEPGDGALESFRSWSQYRDKVIGKSET